MYCEYCGAKLEDDEKFCTFCGKKIERDEEASAQPVCDDTKPMQPVVPETTVMPGVSSQPKSYVASNQTTPSQPAQPQSTQAYTAPAQTAQAYSAPAQMPAQQVSQPASSGLQAITSSKSFPIIVGVVVGVVIAIVVVLALNAFGSDSSKSPDNTAEQSAVVQQDNTANNNQGSAAATQDDDDATLEDDTDEENFIEDDDDWQHRDYVYRDSSTRVFTKAELQGEDLYKLYIGRNEIYAKYGRGFKNEDLQEYFNSKDWYTKKYSPSEFDKMPDPLTKTEKKNADLMLEIEKERNSPYLTTTK